VTAVADAPTLTVQDTTGTEDSAIPLDIAAADLPGGVNLRETIPTGPHTTDVQVVDQTTVEAIESALWDGTEELAILDPSEGTAHTAEEQASAVDHVLKDLDEASEDLTLDLFDEVEQDGPRERAAMSRFDETAVFADAFEMIEEITYAVESAAEPTRSESDHESTSDLIVQSTAWFWIALRAVLGVRRPSE
jgi:hypothetical protein